MPTLNALILATYRSALCLYPSAFQEHNAAEMLGCAHEMISESASPLRTGFVLAEDLFRSLITEHTAMAANLKAIPQLALVFILTTFIAGTAHLISQQVLRMSANDPQIQLAEDGARRLDAGEDLAHIVPAGAVPMENSLATFLIAYDDSGRPVASSATLDGVVPNYPRGVFDFLRNHEEERLTWQPRRGVRIASVAKRTAHGFLVVGRNMREVEEREKITLKLAIAGWISVNILLCGVWLMMQWLGRTHLPRPQLGLSMPSKPS